MATASASRRLAPAPGFRAGLGFGLGLALAAVAAGPAAADAPPCSRLVDVTGEPDMVVRVAERLRRAGVVIRGIRGVTDFEYEYQLTGMNRQLNHRVETVFLMADVALQPIASRLVKEIALYGGPIDKFVTPTVAAEVVARVESIGRKGS